MKPAAILLRWYKQHGRDLPWRHTRDPYRILVSEIMLQQTQVDRVKTFYRAWLKAFPTWKRLAVATNEEVVRAWSGLGYNRRALALRDMAQVIVKTGVPQTEEAWRSLKGIGAYTAAAVSAFAQKKRTMPIDTNIRRVLGRLLLAKPFPDLDDDVHIMEHVDTFLPRRGSYYDIPQAIFDLATSICTKIPDCARCPLRKQCPSATAFLSGTVAVPKQMIKKAMEKKHQNKPYPDRIYRGRILALAKSSPNVAFNVIGKQIDPTFDKAADQVWLEQMIQRLAEDGLIRVHHRTISL